MQQIIINMNIVGRADEKSSYRDIYV